MARSRLSSPGVRRASATASLALCCLVGCNGDLINLGSSEPLVVGGEAGSSSAGASGGGAVQGGGGSSEWIASAEPVLSLEGYVVANPTLTSAGVMFLSILPRGESDPHVYLAEASGDRFATPDPKSPVALAEDDVYGASSPAISLDGQELWFGKGVAGSQAATDVYVTQPEGDGWATPQLVMELSSLEDDAPRPPGLHGTVMPLSSKSHGSEFYQIYFATRDAVGSPWSTPNQDYLATINSDGATSVDGFLTDDGLTLYFASTRGARTDADLFRARRTATDESFGVPEPLDGIPTDSDERDPWLSQDGTALYYATNRTGLYAIYRARRAQ